MTTRTTPLMHHIRRLAAAHAPADPDLLERFPADRDDNARLARAATRAGCLRAARRWLHSWHRWSHSTVAAQGTPVARSRMPRTLSPTSNRRAFGWTPSRRREA